MTDEQENLILYMIWLGIYNENNLPRDLFVYYFADIYEMYTKGYGYATDENDIIQEQRVRENINEFSAGKVLFFVKYVMNFKQTNESFKDDFALFYDSLKNDWEYNAINESWLKAEAETAKAWGESKKFYNRTVKLYGNKKLVMYVTKRDSKVRDEHRLLDGIVFEIGDTRFQAIIPPNGFNCRCKLVLAPDNAIKSNITDILRNANKNSDLIYTILSDFVPKGFDSKIISNIIFGNKTTYMKEWQNARSTNNLNLGYL